MLTKERKEKVVAALQKAIQAKSYSGEEKGVVEYLEKLFKDIGYDTVHIDRYGNIIGCIKGKKNGLKVLMDGHMDTVPVQEEKWKENAFGGTALITSLEKAKEALRGETGTIIKK